MIRTMLASTALALAVGASAPATAAEGALLVVVDPALDDRFRVKREVVDTVQERYGEPIAYDDARSRIPGDPQTRIVPGDTLDAGRAGPLPEGVEPLPTLADDGRWVRVDRHLVEVTPDDRIVMVVYDALR